MNPVTPPMSSLTFHEVSVQLAEDECCLFEPLKKKKSHREAEVSASDFTGGEIFAQTFLLRQH